MESMRVLARLRNFIADAIEHEAAIGPDDAIHGIEESRQHRLNLLGVAAAA
jgi:hypothetical protein